MPMDTAHQEWALIGAKTRLAELEEERKRIFIAFPELRQSVHARAAGVSKAGARGRRAMSAANRRKARERMLRYWQEQRKSGKRRKLSAAARKKLSLGMKRRWAERKAEQSQSAS